MRHVKEKLILQRISRIVPILKLTWLIHKIALPQIPVFCFNDAYINGQLVITSSPKTKLPLAINARPLFFNFTSYRVRLNISSSVSGSHNSGGDRAASTLSHIADSNRNAVIYSINNCQSNHQYCYAVMHHCEVSTRQIA